MASYYDRQVHAEAEKLKRSMAAREGRRKRKLRRGPDPKPATLARGETPTRAESLPVYCQHQDDGAKCWNPTLARDPLAKLPACRKHYQRAYRLKTGKR